MTGYTGKSIRIDLSEGVWDIFETPPELCEKYIGGRGFGVALIREHITKPFDSEDMPIIFASGPLVGTSAPTSGRLSVVSRSPLTSTVFDCSVGGRFATELKRAGFDMLIISGLSREWVTIDIQDGNISIKDAGGLYGRNVEETAAILGDDGSTAIIGRAGERGVRFASIVFDGHYLAGRGGLGAVMGAKRLKAIKIRGTGEVKVADPGALKKAREEIMRLLRASPAVFGEFGLSEFGTAALVDLIHARRMEPTENFRKSVFPKSGQYSGYSMKTAYHTKKKGCRGCPILCKKVGRAGEVMPEFETVSHFGALNGNSDLQSIVEANRLCNDYGLDTITTASTIACYSEFSGKRLSPEELLRHVVLIGERQGIGDALSEGSRRFAESKGVPELSMTVKGLELPAYDPRGAYGMALSYVTSNRGGCHLRAYPISYEILRKPVAVDRFSFVGKARMVKISEDINTVIDSLTACKFVFFAASLEEYAKAINAVTAREYDVQSLVRAGERTWLLERHLNTLNGFSRKDDDLPERFFRDAGYSDENVTIPPIRRKDFDDTLDRYYRIRGYDEEGRVTEEDERAD
ncbi:MAG: aldehyde ferredoxin oxidoreductase family protein [Nitrospirota bacterium]|nr:aldehyde ferredoxin oxidoreductase family protein [Nitrospirota bacterium]